MQTKLEQKPTPLAGRAVACECQSWASHAAIRLNRRDKGGNRGTFCKVHKKVCGGYN